MSEFVQKPGSWNLFRNNKKTADNQPDYRGQSHWRMAPSWNCRRG